MDLRLRRRRAIHERRSRLAGPTGLFEGAQLARPKSHHAHFSVDLLHKKWHSRRATPSVHSESMKTCVYCHEERPMSVEHIVSAGVLRLALGDPIRNIRSEEHTS